jgi:hypothetical protein
MTQKSFLLQKKINKRKIDKDFNNYNQALEDYRKKIYIIA